MDTKKENLKKEYRSILLKTFADFISLCEKHNLTYYGAFGTVLGAVRHGGLIPWDDDIDVFMPRNDYERFLSLKESYLGDYEIVDIENKDYYQIFAKFVNKNTTLIETEEIPFVCGIYVDVFPLDEWNEEFTDCEKWNLKMAKSYFTYFKSLRQHSLNFLLHNIRYGNWKVAAKTLTNICYYQFLRKQSLLNLNNCLTQFKSIRGNYWCRYSPNPKGSFPFPKDWFSEGCVVKFENLLIKIPKEYDKYLHATYGNYMEFPPESQRNSGHQQFYINLNERLSYEDVCLKKRLYPTLCIE